MRETDDSPNETGPIDELDPAGQALFERIGEKLGLGLAVRERRIGRFVIRGELGRGGMGVVLRAFDPILGREVALKLINVRSFAKPEILRARLLQEAQVLAQFQHPNVVRVHEAGEHEGEIFVALELVRGSDLRDWQRATSPKLEAIVRVFIEAGKGLAAAHGRGITHRDFKPDNVLIDKDGQIFVGDFGLAGAIAALPAGGAAVESVQHPRLTGVDELIGTLGYMSPEQLRGEEVDSRTDQFAFCVSLWELLTDHRPFPGKNSTDLLAAMAAPPNGAESLPRWLRPVLTRGLAVNPEQRFPDMPALLDRLEQGLGRKRRWLVAGGVGLATVITVASLLFALASEEPPCEPEQELTDLRESDEWRALTARLDAEGMADIVTPLLTKYERKVAALCETDREADKQQLQMWIRSLRLVANSAPERELDDVVDDIRELRSIQHDRPPPRPLEDGVRDLLLASEQAEREDKLEDAREHADAAHRTAQSDAGRALGLLRHGRVMALLGDDEVAFDEFEQAYHEAIRADYPDAQLRASLLRAKYAIMRLDQLDEGQQWLDFAGAYLDLLDEPRWSSRWTDYYELDATLAKHHREWKRALSSQREVLVRRLLAFDRYGTGLALINLGTVWEEAGHAARAEGSYRLALWLLPEPSPNRRQAEINLGRMLATADEVSDEQAAEARGLLEAVESAQADQHVYATVLLLSLDYVKWAPDAQLRADAAALAQLLTSDVEATSRVRFEGWRAIARIHAHLGDDLTPAIAEIDRLAEQLPDAEIELAWFDLDLISILGIEHGDAFLSRLRRRLPNLPADTREQLESGLESLLESPATHD